MQVAIIGNTESNEELISTSKVAGTGYDTYFAYTSASEFLSDAVQGEIDKVFLSVTLTGSDWVDLVRMLTTTSNIPKMHIIIVGSEDHPEVLENQELLLRYQVKDFLHSPVDSTMFRTLLDIKIIRINLSNNGDLKEQAKAAQEKYKRELIAACDRVFDDLSGTDPTTLDSSKGLISLDKPTLRKQMTQIQQLVKSDPKNYNYKFKMLSYYMETCEVQKAQDCFTDIMKELEERTDTFWLMTLGNICVTQFCLGFASVIAKAMAKKVTTKSSWELSLLRAKIQLVAGRIEDAEVWLNEAVLHNGRAYTEILNLKGIILKRNGDLAGAHKNMTEAFNLSSPADYRIAYNIGLIHEKMGHFSDSITWFKKSIAIYPKFEKARLKLV